MSVSNGQNADETTFNNAFPSRQIDTSLAGIVTLNNTSPASGPTITNIQKEINSATHSVVSTLTISAGGAITIDETIGTLIIPIIGNVTPQDASLTPFGASGLGSGGNVWNDGQRVKLIVTSDTAMVRYQNNDVLFGAILNGDAVMAKYSTIDLIWIASLNRWIEMGRSL